MMSGIMAVVGNVSATDPMLDNDRAYITVTKGLDLYANPAGKTQVSRFLSPDQNIGIFGTIGQSNITSVAPNAYTITNTGKVDNLNIYDGGVFTHADPPLGMTGPTGVVGGGFGHMFGRLADKMITDGWFDRVIGAHAGVGGSAVADWATGGPLNHRLTVIAKRLLSLGRQPSAMLWQQGEGDHGTSQANYTTRVQSVIDTLRSAGLTCPIFIAKTSYSAGATDSNVTAAQAAVVNHGAGVWAGADTDQFTSGSRIADNVHFSDAGMDSVATEWKTKLALYGAPFA